MKIVKKDSKPTRRDIFADFFDEFFNTDFLSSGNTKLVPAVDIFEEKDKYVVKADLPGMKQDDIKVEIEDNVLSISGERKEEKEEKDREYHYYERSYGSFERRFVLPKNAKAEDIKAKYKDGVLEITIPKTEEAKPKQIKIE